METPPKVFAIPDRLCERAGLSFCWRPCNGITVFPYEDKHVKSPDKPSQHAPTDVSIYQVRQNVILFHPVLRNLVNETNGAFLNLQALIDDKQADTQQGLMKISRQYRSIIRACLENLQEELVDGGRENREVLENYITIFYSVECIWHLCEIFFLDSFPVNMMLPRLLEWVQFHFPKHERSATELLRDDVDYLDTHHDYWPTIIGSLLQGRIKIARCLLSKHSAADTKPFRIADEILKRMPIFDILGGRSCEEFKVHWQQWTIEVQSKIDCKLFAAHENLEFIVKLVIADSNVWKKISGYCETWYEFLAAALFYKHPTVRPYELGEFAKNSLKAMGVFNKMRHLDTVILAVLQSDVLEVIKEIQNMNDGGWFATHLTDLLLYGGALRNLEKENQNFSARSLRDHLVLDYGTTLMGHQSLWQVGLSYLDHCSKGLHAIELLLPRIYSSGERKTQRLVKEAKKRKLFNVAQFICKAEGMRSLGQDRLGNALTWALKSQDGIFVSFIAEKYLKSYAENRKLRDSDLLFNLGPSMLISDRLTFLGRYYEFHKIYEAKQYVEAGKLLIKLIESRITPNYFWNILLTDAIPLLESEALVFSTNDTYSIMICVMENEKDVALKDKLEVLRFAATRNLSLSMIYDLLL